MNEILIPQNCWTEALARAVREAGPETVIVVNTEAKRALAVSAAERLGKVIRCEVRPAGLELRLFSISNDGTTISAQVTHTDIRPGSDDRDTNRTQELTEKDIILAALMRIEGGAIETVVDADRNRTQIRFDCPAGGYGSAVYFEFDPEGSLQDVVGYGD